MRALYKITIPIALALLATSIYQQVLETGYRRMNAHKTRRLAEIYGNSTDYDLLLLGSSRMHTAVHPRILDSATGLRTFNAGVGGANLFEFRVTLEGYLVHHPPPRLVLLSLDGPSFGTNRRKLFHPLTYFAQLDNPVVARTFRQIPGYYRACLEWLPPLRVIYYDDHAQGLAWRGLAGHSELEGGYEEYKGYWGNGHVQIDTADEHPYKETTLDFDSTGRACLRSILDTCKARGIEVLLTYAPEYRGKLQASYRNFPVFLQLVDSMRGSLPFLREDARPLCREPRYFANYGHLNTEGAAAYTRDLGPRIRQLLTKKS